MTYKLEPEKMKVDMLTRQSICDIVNKFYHEVEADYCNTIPDDQHIYYAFRHVQKWLESHYK